MSKLKQIISWEYRGTCARSIQNCTFPLSNCVNSVKYCLFGERVVKTDHWSHSMLQQISTLLHLMVILTRHYFLYTDVCVFFVSRARNETMDVRKSSFVQFEIDIFTQKVMDYGQTGFIPRALRFTIGTNFRPLILLKNLFFPVTCR